MRSIIEQEYKNPYAIVRVDGSILRDVLSIEVNKSYENTISSATVSVANKPFSTQRRRLLSSWGITTKHILCLQGMWIRLSTMRRIMNINYPAAMF